MARTNDTRSRVRELAAELASQGQEPSPTVIMRMLGRGSPNTIVDELRRWKEETAIDAQRASSVPAATPSAKGDDTATSTLSQLRQLLEPLSNAVQHLSQRIDEQEKAHAAQVALAYDRFTAVQKMAMVAIDEAREQTRFWKQEAERAKFEASAQADSYRDAMRSAQGEARRLAELLHLHQAGSAAVPGASLRVPPSPSLPGVGAAPAHSKGTPGPREPALPRQYDPDGHADE